MIRADSGIGLGHVEYPEIAVKCMSEISRALLPCRLQGALWTSFESDTNPNAATRHKGVKIVRIIRSAVDGFG